MFQKTYRDRKGKLQKTASWSYKYNQDGRTYYVHTGSLNRAVADQGLREKLASMGRGLPPGNAAERLRWEDASLLIVNDYRVKAQNLDRLGAALRHLDSSFAGMKLLKIDAAAIQAYIVKRISKKTDTPPGEGAAAGTVNLELAALKRAFRLSVIMRQGLLWDHVPHIQMLPLHNIRQDSITPAQLYALLDTPAMRKHPDVRDLIEFAGITGWRARSDVLSRRWVDVKWARNIIELESGKSKGKKMRLFPIPPGSRLRAMLERRRAGTPESCEWIFHRKGKRMRNFIHVWEKAIAELAVLHPDWHVERIIRHTLRYGAVDNWLDSGTNTEAICKIVGMTPQILSRYHIMSDQKAAAAGAGLEKLLDRRIAEGAAPDVERVVLPFTAGKKA